MPMRISSRGAAALIGAGAAALPAASAQQADDFLISAVAEGLDRPVALALAPDGRIFVTEKLGAIRIVDGDGLQSEPFRTVEVLDQGETGLLGIALDPDFDENGYVYVFATISTAEQRILRFSENDPPDTPPTIIRANLPSSEDVHVGGGLRFGPDGMLYFSIGDTGVSSDAQSLGSFRGKLCRVQPDGVTPSDNPFSTITGAPSAIFALGLRNPFRFTIASDGRVFIMDVGSFGAERREEVNIAYPGDNFGWPLVEGKQSVFKNPQFKDPAIAYNDDGAAITGVVYYSGDAFPAEYCGDLFHLEFVQNQLYHVALDGDEVLSHQPILEVGGGPVDLIQDHDGTLLICEHYAGRISRLSWDGPVNDIGRCEEADSPPGDSDADDAGDQFDAGGDDGAVDDPAAGDSPADGATGDNSDDASDSNADGDDLAEVGGSPVTAPPPFCGFGLPFAVVGVSSLLVTRKRLS